MFGELPKLLGKTFLIGYLLPAALLMLAGVAISDVFLHTTMYAQALKLLGSTDEKVLAFRLGLAVAVAWAGGIVLLSINQNVIRLLEGYGDYNPARLLTFWSTHVFDQLTAEHDRIEAKRVDGKMPRALVSAHFRMRYRLGNEFPEERRLLLPTRFGNILRAFERYPQVVYSMDSIHTWPRLQALIPEKYASLLDDAKAQLDFWVNLWFGCVLLAIGVLGLFAYVRDYNLGIAFAAAVILAITAAKFGQTAAAQWGVLVKGAFDLYRGDLCKQLGLEMPESIDNERQMWRRVSQTFLLRRPEYAEGLDRFRLAESDEKSTSWWAKLLGWLNCRNSPRDNR